MQFGFKSSAMIATLVLSLVACAYQRAAPVASKSAPSDTGGSAADKRVVSLPIAATDAAPGSGPEDEHRGRMQNLHHQGHSEHKFRAIHDMEEMHRMGGVPAMPPLDELGRDRSGKMTTQ